MTILEVLEGLPGHNKAKIHLLLNAFSLASGVGRQAVTNFFSETRLSQGAWAAFIEQVGAANTPTEVHRNAISAFRLHLLTAEEVHLHTTLLCRVMTAQQYRVMVADKLNLSITAVEQLMLDLLVSPNASLLNSFPELCPWRAGRIVWATFATDPNDMPLSDCTTCDEVRAVLGLDPADRGKPVYAFHYTLPAHVKAHFPTIAEAYAGDVWQVHFRPAPPGATYGQTMTWDEAADLAPRPEVVHWAFEGGTFVQALKEVR